MDIATFRSLFPIAEQRSYLYNGALAPAAAPVTAALQDWSHRWALDPISCYDGAVLDLQRLRAAFAGLIGADPADVAITDNTSRASNIVTAALSARPGSNVVIDDTTYPSSAYPWLAMTQLELRSAIASQASDPLDAVASSIDGSTVAVCVSHVAPETGFRHDLAALSRVAHEHDALLVVDCAQTTGVLPIDIHTLGVDALVTTAMKWMLGPPGVGFAYVARHLIADAPAHHIGYMSVDLPMSESWPMTTLPPLIGDARRFELGLPTLAGLGAARAGIELLQSVGVDAVHRRVEQLATRCIEGLTERSVLVRTPLDTARRCGVIAIEHRQAPALAAHLRERAVDIGGYDWGVARIDPHAFNDEADIGALLAGIDTFPP